MEGMAFLAAPLLAFFVAAASPGPATLAVAATAMARGRAAGLALGAGLAVGLAFWGLVAAAGLGPLMVQSASALLVLRLLGGGYLLYLAWCSARSALRPGDDGAAPTGALSGRAAFQRGVVLNLLNPKAVLAWIAVLAIGLPAGAGAAEIAVVTLACALLGLAIYAVYALALSLPSAMAFYVRARRRLEAVFAAFFGYAGLRLVFARSDTP
ncbi:MAG: LysE family transporter [Pseudomonadota bacterium]